MTDTRQEALIREAIAAEAHQAVDPRAVLAVLHGARARRRPFALFAAVGLTAAAAAVAVVVPLTVDRTASAPPAGQAPPATTALLIGTDGARNADSVVLARVAGDGGVSAAFLPRDALVDVPGAGVDRLGSVYGRAAAAGGRDGEQAGAEALRHAVESLTGVRVDHYATLDLAGFPALSDAVGGVDVCLNRPVRDALSGVDLPAGPVTLRGAQATAFLRQRVGLPHGDLDRIARQQVFLGSLATEVLGAGDPATPMRVVTAARSAVRTDPGWDLPDLARRLKPAVRTAVIPTGEEVDTGAVRGRPVDSAAVRAFATEFFADRPADPADPRAGTTAPGGPPTRCVD
ncbi:LCP family protein [Actinosynnema sp. NPDC053489]|uniref:LCP family protein n=1 Tax=Actinosynnema sp. NPDC053489 TaxID=3363916 RepID=UPI0037C5ACB1